MAKANAIQKKAEVKKVNLSKAAPKVTQIVTLPKANLPKAEKTSIKVPTVSSKASETKNAKKPTKDVQKATPKALTENVGAKRISAGSTIRDTFLDALEQKLIDDKAMAILTNPEKTKEVLKIRYAFLMEVVTGDKKERLVNGCPRYTAKPIVEYKGKKFYITNDLYDRNVPVFKKWIDSLKGDLKEAKKEAKNAK